VFSAEIVVSKLGTCAESCESVGEGNSVSELDMDDSKNFIAMPIVVESHRFSSLLLLAYGIYMIQSDFGSILFYLWFFASYTRHRK
jgi:hypothetical protein